MGENCSSDSWHLTPGVAVRSKRGESTDQAGAQVKVNHLGSEREEGL